MRINLPALFEEKLAEHDQEKGVVYSSLASFGKWFEISGTPVFFRDYTDHGPKHVSSVLATAAAMIPKAAVLNFSSADTTILVLATLLHDAALHLAEPGFHQLIKGDARDRMITEFDQSTWYSLWDEFLFNARRWNDHKIAGVFGDEFLRSGHMITNPFDRWGNLTLADYKLIGEFIRQHHPRLAHEFAVFGVPGLTAASITLPVELSKDWHDLVGIVARSHGMPLRACLDIVSKKYHKRDYQRIHLVYLMALLRLSDYLQIDASRAPEIVFRYRVLPSRNSALEWRAHSAVKNITPESEDPELVEIHSEPSDVETYLRLREWLDGIQKELDVSWAVLGENYGRYANLRDLGLHWRRVRSNLDSYSTFAATVPYLPRRIRIEVARSELLSLLIRPLYGDEPSYGVRELMQNAIDAVREREYFQQRNPEYSEVKLRNQEADVVIWLSNFDEKSNSAWLEVSDRGIGMNEQIITDYFLTAGASYRHSEQWQRNFERSDLPPDKTRPRAQILRSGRFGVGALTAFLLGEEIEVETRHVTSPDGYRFRMSLTQDAVQIERATNIPVGTRIRAQVSRTAFDKLLKENDTVSKPGLWDWYVLNKPTVARLFGKGRRPLEQRPLIDLRNWHLVQTSLPLDIYWTFDATHQDRVPRLSCNGIFVSDSAKLPEITAEQSQSSPYQMRTPCLHVMDPDGHLPLGLTRKEIVEEEYGFEKDLCTSIMRDFFAHILSNFPEDFAPNQIIKVLGNNPFRAVYNGSKSVGLPCLLGPEGFCLPFDQAFIASPRPISRLLWLTSLDSLKHVPNVHSWDCVVVNNRLIQEAYRVDGETFLKFLRHGQKQSQPCQMRCTSNYKRRVPVKESGGAISGIGWLLPNQVGKWMRGKEASDKFGCPSYANENNTEVLNTETCWLIENQGMAASQFPFEKALDNARMLSGEIHGIEFVAECIFPKPWSRSINAEEIGDWWNHFFGNNWIPWKKSDRMARFPKAYAELSHYLAHNIRPHCL